MIRTAWHIRSVFAVIAMALLFAWGVQTAEAQENSGATLSIAPNGQVIVKGAIVTGVHGNVLTAETGWGSARLIWTVQTTGSTRFSPDLGSEMSLAGIRAGHTIAFSGVLSGSAAHPTVLASAVKDSELVRDAMTLVGTVEAVDAASGMVRIGVQGETTNVAFSDGTLLSRDGGYARVDDIRVGDSLRVTGTLNTATDTLSASRATVKSPEEPTEMAVSGIHGQSVFAAMLEWLRGSRGILSVRDR